MPEAATPVQQTIKGHALQWLALTLTRGMGADQGSPLVKLFGGLQGISKAAHRTRSPEPAGGVRAVLATGSLDLAQREELRAKGARAGKTWGRNCLQMCDLGWSPRWTMNRRAGVPHLYLVNATCLRTKRRSLLFRKRMKLSTSMRSSNVWSLTCRPQRFLRLFRA